VSEAVPVYWVVEEDPPYVRVKVQLPNLDVVEHIMRADVVGTRTGDEVVRQAVATHLATQAALREAV
jgi:hypothetical protein